MWEEGATDAQIDALCRMTVSYPSTNVIRETFWRHWPCETVSEEQFLSKVPSFGFGHLDSMKIANGRLCETFISKFGTLDISTFYFT